MEYLLGFLLGMIVCFFIMICLTNNLLDNYVKNKLIPRKGKVYKLVEVVDGN